MDRNEIEQLLRKSLHDGKLSRGEKAILRSVLDDDAMTPHIRDWIRNRAFAVARSEFITPDGAGAIAWLESVMGILVTKERPVAVKPSIAEAHFSPGDECLRRIQRLIRESRFTLDVCVFTITDDRIARSLLDAHDRGVRLRLISDDEKAGDIGSDLAKIRSAGVPTVFDRTRDHMHHKFAISDKRLVVSGSYNWTRSAATRNQENIIVLGDPRLVAGFQTEFEKLWKELAA